MVELHPLLALQQDYYGEITGNSRNLSHTRTHLGLDIIHGLVGVHVVIGALDHGMLWVGLVLVIPELVLLPVMDDLGNVGYLGFQVDLRRAYLSSFSFRCLTCRTAAKVNYLIDQEPHGCGVIAELMVSSRLRPSSTITRLFTLKISRQGPDARSDGLRYVYRVVQKKGTVLLSTSLAWPAAAVAGCSWAEAFSQLSSISFAQPCT